MRSILIETAALAAADFGDFRVVETALTPGESRREPSRYPLPPSFDAGGRAAWETEFRGEHFFDAPPKPGEAAGHIPGARHLPYDALLRSSLVWMVFKHVLGFPRVRNYDGSWNGWSLRAQETQEPETIGGGKAL